MTLRLILTRHAKSAWDTPASGDHDRPLNARGQRAAKALGNWLVQAGHVPAQVLSSDAQRTRETWDLIQTSMTDDIAVHWTRALYLAPAQAMLDVLRAKAHARAVLMLGHNPGIAMFAAMLVRTPPSHQRFRDYPTGATTVIEFDLPDWTQVDWGLGNAVEFVVPRELV